jgi:probable rRNA maturation factor
MMDSVEPDQDIIIRISQSFKEIDFSLPRLKKLVKTTCNRFSKNTTSGGRKYEISIAIIDDAGFRELNSRYLGRKSTSDCLSFDLSDEKSDSYQLFEIVANGEVAVKQANLRGHPPEAELALYVTHGLLHNLGLDDSTEGKAKKMHNIEDEILQQHGYGIVYNKNLSARECKARKNK